MARYIIPILAAVVLLGAGGAVYFSDHAAAQGPGGAMPPTPVTVETVQPQTVRLSSDFSGRLVAVDAAEIRPQVSGRITEIKFDDGQNVKAGDVLVVIDPRPYQDAVAKAEADVESARTNAQFATTDFQHAQDLIKSQAIAQRMFDQRKSSHDSAAAAVKSAEAALRQAKLNLEYAYVRAPISGRVSRAEITVGNLVQSGQNAPLLTTIVSSDGIYADFDVDEQTYLANIRAGANGQTAERQIPVDLNVRDDKDHVYHGMIYSFDNQINPATGTIRARAKFKNEDGALVPGMFVSVRLSSSQSQQALTVPERAVGTDQSKKFVYVVSPDNKVEYREVSLGTSVNGNRIVQSGLLPGDKVIVDGTLHVRPGAAVQATEITSDADKMPAGSAPAPVPAADAAKDQPKAPTKDSAQ